MCSMLKGEGQGAPAIKYWWRGGLNKCLSLSKHAKLSMLTLPSWTTTLHFNMFNPEPPQVKHERHISHFIACIAIPREERVNVMKNVWSMEAGICSPVWETDKLGSKPTGSGPILGRHCLHFHCTFINTLVHHVHMLIMLSVDYLSFMFIPTTVQ